MMTFRQTVALRIRAAKDPEEMGEVLAQELGRLETAVRELDRVISRNGPPIRSDHPEDHGISAETAALVEWLRR